MVEEPLPLGVELSQHARLLKVDVPLPFAALVVERMWGREAVSECYRFIVDCLSAEGRVDLCPLLGEEVTVRLLLADGGHRAWHGHVTEALWLGSDGGLSRCRLVMEPWLSFLGLRRDCRVFQDKTAVEIAGEIFGSYPQANWSSHLTRAPRSRRVSTQYRETDLGFVARLLSEEGISWRFAHGPSGQAGVWEGGEEGVVGGRHGRHRLILFDRGSPVPSCAQSVVRYHRADATECSDTLQAWQEVRRVRGNAAALSGWDYKRLGSPGAVLESSPAGGLLPRLEEHHCAPYLFEDVASAELGAGLRLSAHESHARRFRGAGSARQLAEGTAFALVGHEGYAGEASRFTVLCVEHRAANNLGAELSGLLGQCDVESGSYRNALEAQAFSQPLVPAPLEKPVAHPQSALVVGAVGQAVTSDRDHRVKIQFPWQRGVAPNPGGLEAEAGNAPGDDRSGAWARVSEWLSGPGWGGHFLPRAGSEVLVEFLDGDIDRPVITGSLHNGSDRPPLAGGEGSVANHPGVLSGWTSHNFGSGHNQWVVDDAPGQVRTRLSSSEEASQLGLGHLIHQPAESAARGAWRGSGFELRTDGWLAIRAGAGLLLSATARPGGQGAQLGAREAAAQLKGASSVAQGLSEAAGSCGGVALGASGALPRLIQGIGPAQDGSRGSAGSAGRFARALTLAEAPGDIGHASPGSLLAYAGGHLHATAQGELHLAGGHTVAAAAGREAGLYAHAGGVRSIAQSGPHTVRAHGGPLEVLADRSLAVSSSADEVHLLAKEKIVLRSCGASVTLEGSDVTFACPGTFSVKGARNALLGPGRDAATLEKLPDDQMKEIPFETWKMNRKHPVSR